MSSISSSSSSKEQNKGSDSNAAPIKWDQLADESSIKKTVESLRANGMDAVVVENSKQAKEKVLEMMPSGAEVMNMTSMTLDATSISNEIMESGKFNSARKTLASMDGKTQSLQMQKLGAAPEWVVGSVHAVTEDGKAIIVSATGSQLPAYAYGSSKVIWVVGTQKIVKNLDEALKRIYEYVFPLEDARARKAYGIGSGVNKMLIINKEVTPGRIAMILVKEKLGF
jgi:hypothetical protein